jgi:hypothetical protein
MGKQTDAQPVFDFPAAWKSVEPTKTDQHHERCSYRQTDRALLCDCAAVIAAEAAWHLAHQEPAPDWADLREMARNAGWSGRRDPDQNRVRIWGHYGKGRMFIDWEHGWARVYQGPNAIVIDLSSSGELHHETVHLLNPTPARVLAAARLVGLVGAS